MAFASSVIALTPKLQDSGGNLNGRFLHFSFICYSSLNELLIEGWDDAAEQLPVGTAGPTW